MNTLYITLYINIVYTSVSNMQDAVNRPLIGNRYNSHTMDAGPAYGAAHGHGNPK